MDVAVTGSNGFIGSALVPALEAAGHRVVPVTRRPPAASDGRSGTIAWDPARGEIDAGGFEAIGAVVHLAGEGIGDRRWNDAHKAKVMDSRRQGTALLAETLAGLSRPPAVLVSGSAVGYYGDRGDEMLTEDSPPGAGFLAEVVQAWEAATAPAEAAGIRVAHIRTGIVLDQNGGALAKMLTPFRFGVGGRLGSGRQWMSWIVLADEVGAIMHVLGDGGLRGAVNLTAPAPVRNAELARMLGSALHRPAVLPVPAAALRLLLGTEMADELLLASQRAVPSRLAQSGFTFSAPDLPSALAIVLR